MALLLLVTYRSPLLVVVPLAVVAVTEQATLALIAQVLPRVDLPDGGQATGIASVLVFGAATNYALLLIARYRQQLRVEPVPLVAMRTALTRTTEAIVASGGSVLIALEVLLLASSKSLGAVAVACLIGIALAMVTGLLVLPAVLVLLGRAAFWPFVPRVGDRPSEGRLWGRLGQVVLRPPARTLAVSVAVLAVLAGGLLGLRTGLSQNEVLLDPPESVTAAERLADAQRIRARGRDRGRAGRPRRRRGPRPAAHHPARAATRRPGPRGFPAVDGGVVISAFLFLVALGVDYNIFLTTRAREEAAQRGTRTGMLAALRVTGGVITSAGLLLAAVIAVLGVLPIIVLTQIGIIVCIGVLLDTLLVRTVVVPALAFLLGDRFWWPARPARTPHYEAEPELAAAR